MPVNAALSTAPAATLSESDEQALEFFILFGRGKFDTTMSLRSNQGTGTSTLHIVRLPNLSNSVFDNQTISMGASLINYWAVYVSDSDGRQRKALQGDEMRIWTFAASILLSASAVAQQGYEFIRYRANDPFVFCTKGQRTPDKCWWPVTPYLGQYMMNPACDPPDPYGKPWTAADTDSLGQYLEICPQAITSGSWKGTVPPEMSPFTH